MLLGTEVTEPQLGMSPDGVSSSARPTNGLDGSAWNRRGMRPAAAGQPARLHGSTHCAGHGPRVVRPGDGRRDQDRVTTELHGETGVGGGADPGVEHNRNLSALPDECDVVGVADAEPAADRRLPRGITAAHPTCSSLRARTGSSLV